MGIAVYARGKGSTKRGDGQDVAAIPGQRQPARACPVDHGSQMMAAMRIRLAR